MQMGQERQGCTQGKSRVMAGRMTWSLILQARVMQRGSQRQEPASRGRHGRGQGRARVSLHVSDRCLLYPGFGGSGRRRYSRRLTVGGHMAR